MKTKNKLASYLAKTGEPHRTFAERAGIYHLHPMVSQWTDPQRSGRFPGLDAALAIEEATGGEIPVSYWRDLRKSLKMTQRERR